MLLVLINFLLSNSHSGGHQQVRVVQAHAHQLDTRAERRLLAPFRLGHSQLRLGSLTTWIAASLQAKPASTNQFDLNYKQPHVFVFYRLSTHTHTRERE